MSRFFADDAVLVTGVCVVTMGLKPNHSFIVLSRGTPPYAYIPDGGPGRYALSVEELAPGATFPLMILSVPTEHAGAFEAMPLAKAEAILDGALKTARGTVGSA